MMAFEIHPKKRVPIKLQTPLANAFGFDYGDLQDNRMGFISNWQKGRLRWYLLSYTYSIIVWLVGLVSITSFVVYALLGSVMAILSGIGVIMFGMIMWLYKLRAVLADMQGGQITELNNVVHHDRDYHKKTTNYRRSDGTDGYHEIDYYLQIGSERFSVLRDQMQSLKDGAEYRVYIALHSRQILSVELLTQDDLDEFEQELFYGKEKTAYYTDKG